MSNLWQRMIWSLKMSYLQMSVVFNWNHIGKQKKDHPVRSAQRKREAPSRDPGISRQGATSVVLFSGILTYSHKIYRYIRCLPDSILGR